MTLQEIRSLVASREWFHSIDLGNGIVTPGSCTPDYLKFFMQQVRFPDRFERLRVLDIGAYDGFFSFEAERRGAAHVTAIDVNPIDCRCMKIAHEVLESRVEYHHMSVYNLDPGVIGTFDVVFFFGVYYHLRYPLLALDQIWNVVRPGGYVLVETHVIDKQFVLADGSTTDLESIDPRLTEIPLYRFYRLNELNPVDYSNWFGGNIEAIRQGLLSAGFEPEVLTSWKNGTASRAAFRARRKEGRQEFRIQTYEGTDFDYAPDGSWRVNWYTHQ
jgi:tRNA (mo5U34)-methyltransferase